MAKLVNASIQFSTQKAKKAMLPAIARELNNLVQKNIKRIKVESQLIIEEEIKNDEDGIYESLIGDDTEGLRAEFGIEGAFSKTQAIINEWVRGLQIDVKPIVASGTRIRGGFSLYAIDSSYQDVISMEEAHHLVERKNNQEVNDIKWLEWLLTEGQNPLVYDFYVTDVFDPERYESRTGLAVMKHSALAGEVWRVPAFAAGTNGDNWITRAMKKAAKKIQSVIAILIKTEVSSPATFR